MKKVIALMFGLVAGTSSFANTTDNVTPDVVVTSSSQKIQLYVAPQTAIATVKLVDEQGHLLYVSKKDIANGLRQTFNLTQLEPGKYHLSVYKAGQTIEKTVVIETVPAQKQIILEV